MSNMCLHCNATQASYDDLKAVVTPDQHAKFADKCGRYGIVPHHRLVDAIRIMSAHMFGKDALISEQFGLSTGEVYPGARFFGLFKFDLDGGGVEKQMREIEGQQVHDEITDDDEIREGMTEEQELEAAAEATLEYSKNRITQVDDSIYPAFAIRNSHDRSMGISAALGNNCFICDNLSLSGDVMFARKHTINAMQDVMLTFWSLIKTLQEQFTFDVKFREECKANTITNDYGFEILGRLAGMGVLPFEGGNKSQFATAMAEWKNPRFDFFAPRNLWSLHNAITFAQRKSGIGRRLEVGSTGTNVIRQILDERELGDRWTREAAAITEKYRNPSKSTILELLDIITSLPKAE